MADSAFSLGATAVRKTKGISKHASISSTISEVEQSIYLLIEEKTTTQKMFALLPSRLMIALDKQ